MVRPALSNHAVRPKLRSKTSAGSQACCKDPRTAKRLQADPVLMRMPSPRLHMSRVRNSDAGHIRLVLQGQSTSIGIERWKPY